MKKINTSSGIIEYKPVPTYWGVSKIDKVVAKENIFIVKEKNCHVSHTRYRR